MLGELSQDEIRFLGEIKRFSTTLSDGDKRLVLAIDPQNGHSSPATNSKKATRPPTNRIARPHLNLLLTA